eukprot:TRINITY_DN594_c0_g1_i11.p1 TRINITY_DN594_c0_g1~~TRINITY_DN594_c0_g1_i11.p1  ORF type:complete len:1301 (+),score=238.90 TRINITY_DN594_c0_g1_i11:4352-8254(+)
MMISAPVELHKAFNENLRKKCTDGNMVELLRESIELHELDQEKGDLLIEMYNTLTEEQKKVLRHQMIHNTETRTYINKQECLSVKFRGFFMTEIHPAADKNYNKANVEVAVKLLMRMKEDIQDKINLLPKGVKENKAEIIKELNDQIRVRCPWMADRTKRSMIFMRYLKELVDELNDTIIFGDDTKSAELKMVEKMIELGYIYEALNPQIDYPYTQTPEQEEESKQPGLFCQCCQKPIEDGKSVVHHDHYSGKIIYNICCQSCNSALKCKKLICLMHNSSGYDNVYIMNGISQCGTNIPPIKVIAKSAIKFMNITIGNISIKDTKYFCPASLDKKIESMKEAAASIIRKECFERKLITLENDPEMYEIMFCKNPFYILTRAADERVREICLRVIKEIEPFFVEDQTRNYYHFLERDIDEKRDKKLEELRRSHLKNPWNNSKAETERIYQEAENAKKALRDAPKDNLYEYLYLVGEKLPMAYLMITSRAALEDTTIETMLKYDCFNNKDKPSDLKKATALCELVKLKTFRDYHDIYLYNDVAQLADWARYFGNDLYKNLSIFPFTSNFSAASATYSAAMDYIAKSGIELEQFLDLQSYKMWNRGQFGGLSNIRRSRVVGKYGESIITSFDANALYPSIMQLAMPYGNFQWVSAKEIARINKNINKYVYKYWDTAQIHENNYLEKGSSSIWEFDGHFTVKSHRYFRDFCPLLEHEPTLFRDLSLEQQDLYKKLVGDEDTKKIPELKDKKLMATFYPRFNQVADIRTLRIMIDRGFVIDKVHNIQTFGTARFLKLYLDTLNELRSKATTTLSGEFMKIFSNSLYGIFILNLEGKKKVTIHKSTSKQCERLVNSIYCDRTDKINDDLTMVTSMPSEFSSTYPRYISQYALMLTKIFMFEAYEIMKVAMPRTELVLGDTDSFYMKMYLDDIPENERIKGDKVGFASVMQYVDKFVGMRNEDGSFKYHSGYFFNAYENTMVPTSKMAETRPDDIRNDKSLPVHFIDTSNHHDPFVKKLKLGAKRAWCSFKFDKTEYLREIIALAPKTYSCLKSFIMYDLTIKGPRGKNWFLEFKCLQDLPKTKTQYPDNQIIEESDDKVVIRTSKPITNLESCKGCTFSIDCVDENPLNDILKNDIRTKGINKDFRSVLTHDAFKDVKYNGKTKIVVENIDRICRERNKETGKVELFTIKENKTALTAQDLKSYDPTYKLDDENQIKFNFGDIGIFIVKNIGKRGRFYLDEITDMLLKFNLDETIQDVLLEPCKTKEYLEEFTSKEESLGGKSIIDVLEEMEGKPWEYDFSMTDDE